MSAVSTQSSARRRLFVRPDLSVVIPSVSGEAALMECLDALRANATAGIALEILVVDRCGESLRSQVRNRYHDVVIEAVSPATTIPRMREIAMRRASADAVAVIEDHVMVPRGWAGQMLEALAEGADVVGGSIDNGATERTSDWAAFLCEYSHVLPSLRSRPTATIPGNNVAYRRSVLERYWPALSAGRWEDHLHSEMRRHGVVMTCRPEICVRHKMPFRVREYLTQRYLYARAYAGSRSATMSAVRRTAYAAGALALPPVLLVRIIGRVVGRRRHYAELLRSLPLLALFVCAWAAGEVVGYAAGPGDALARVR